jgi:hypothetical protein
VLRKRAISALVIFAIVAVALTAVRWTGVARSLAYFPSRDSFTTPEDYEDVWITASDGTRIHGWFMPAINDGDEPLPAVLHLHGNAGNVSHHTPFSAFLTTHGMHVLLIDYRCFGRSDENPPLRRDRVMLDAEAAFDYLVSREDVDAERVGVLGMSLGGAFAMELAARREMVRAVATIGAFSTWKGAAADTIPLLGPFLFPGGMDPIDSVGALGSRPLMLVHGSEDAVIDVRHAHRLAEHARALGIAVTTRIIEGGGHVWLLDRDMGRGRWDIGSFFRRSMGLKPIRSFGGS